MCALALLISSSRRKRRSSNPGAPDLPSAVPASTERRSFLWKFGPTITLPKSLTPPANLVKLPGTFGGKFVGLREPISPSPGRDELRKASLY